jgi:hypothetical protein
LADIEEENDIEGKFITSPNDSLANIHEGLRDSEPHDYSFGDAERISMMNRDHENYSPLNLEIQGINQKVSESNDRINLVSSLSQTNITKTQEKPRASSRNLKSPNLQVLKKKLNSNMDVGRSTSKLSKIEIEASNKSPKGTS